MCTGSHTCAQSAYLTRSISRQKTESQGSTALKQAVHMPKNSSNNIPASGGYLLATLGAIPCRDDCPPLSRKVRRPSTHGPETSSYKRPETCFDPRFRSSPEGEVHVEPIVAVLDGAWLRLIQDSCARPLRPCALLRPAPRISRSMVATPSAHKHHSASAFYHDKQV
jgi:hypothetical protein